MEMVRSVSLHRIFAFHDAYSNHIERIDEIDPKHTHSGRNLSSNNDSTRSNEKAKHDGSTITDKSSSLAIDSSHEIGSWYDDSKDGEEESRIFLSEWI